MNNRLNNLLESLAKKQQQQEPAAGKESEDEINKAGYDSEMIEMLRDVRGLPGRDY